MSDLIPWCDDDKEDESVHRYTGVPNEPFRENEPTRWQRFLKSFMPWFSKKAALSDKLSEQFVKAKTRDTTGAARIKEGRGRKHAEEAREIAARKDQQRIANAEKIMDIADEKFADDPHTQKAIKLAALDEMVGPKMAKQIAKLRSMLADLEKRHGTTVEIVTDANALPPPSETDVETRRKP